MAEVAKQKILCPTCKKAIEIGIWDSIEMPYDIEQKEKVLKNTFFKVYCDDCNKIFPIGYKCKYNDMEQKYLIWLAPKYDDADKQEIANYNNQLKTDKRLQLAQGGYKYRIVRNDNELREKVLIFDEGLDDRYIETLKMVYAPIVQQNLGEEGHIIGFYFDKKKDGGYQWVVLSNNKAPMAIDVKMDIYEDMKVKLKDAVEEKTGEGLIQINAPWALEIMMQKSEEEKAAKEKAESAEQEKTEEKIEA